ncbi:long-chain fatty acid transport protein 4-like [Zophobas morio]|uniref:long-chain fatty acid transport protein 4-like n=1 Tax=Zophobas morio TaxID=2755281 RepID=UPI003082E34A
MMLTVLLVVPLVLFLFCSDYCKSAFQIFTRDLKFITNVLLFKIRFRSLEKKETVAKIFTSILSKHSHNVAFYFEEQKWTFLDVEIYSNKIAHFFKKEGYSRNEIVALFLENRPEYGCIWLGLGKIGVVSALINTNLTGEVLLHSIKTAKVGGIIYSSTLKNVIGIIAEKIPNIKLYQLNDKIETCNLLRGAVDLTTKLKTQSESSPTEDINNGKLTDKLLLIYTSGTTGLPKATVLTNKRIIFVNVGASTFAKLSSDDIVYTCLPFYHGSAAAGITWCFLFGLSVVIKKKFSASNFWNDCVKYKCTVFQYVGEICRYILAAHNDTEFHVQHHVKKIMGNGLRPQIWEKFVRKFNIKQVFEVYGSIDGNTTIINTENKVGAVGFFPRWASFISPVKLIKCDEETGAPIQGSDGFYQLCKTGEPGLLIGNIDFKNNMTGFFGYQDKTDTEKKLLRSVFRTGGVYFNSGDILVQDESGYFYFRDRTGDTFRWKGENVSTSEVEAVISNLLNLEDAVVYGVKVPFHEGRAGMVALIDRTQSFNVNNFYDNLNHYLPMYCIPLFVRVVRSVSLTGTFKLLKVDLQREGFDVGKIKDKMFVYDVNKKSFVDLNEKMYDDILTGKIKF